MAELLVTPEGGVFVDLPKPYDLGHVEAVREALVALFPGQEVRVLVGAGATPKIRVAQLPGRRTNSPVIDLGPYGRPDPGIYCTIGDDGERYEKP